MTTDFHEMNLREQLTLNAALQAQIDHLAAALADERRHADALAEALGRCLRFMEGTENELAITLESSEQGRAIIAQHRSRRQR